MITIYALADPRYPTEMRYVGRTSVAPFKRFRDHIGQAIFRDRNDQTLAPVHRWILGLLDEGLEPIQVILCSHEDDVSAMNVEATFIETFPSLLNDKRPVYLRTGKPAGTPDSASSLRNKRAAAASPSVQKQKRKARGTSRRHRLEALGYPYPDLSVIDELNRDHYRVLHGLKPRVKSEKIRDNMRAGSLAAARRKFREWREAIGFPNPDFGSGHPDNYEWTVQNKGYPRYYAWIKGR